jgi:hypothetical protein
MWAPVLAQRATGTNGAIVTIAWKKYLPTVITVVHSRAHSNTVSGEDNSGAPPKAVQAKKGVHDKV